MRATRITQPIKIDGRLDDAAYREVAPITEFIQQEPNEGAPVTEKTEAWVLFDDKNIYVACRCWDEHPERIVANDMRRDSSNLGQHDHFAVGFDTFHDRRNGFQFGVTAAGGMRDATITDERINNVDWNTVWDAQGQPVRGRLDRRDGHPLQVAALRPGREQTWGIQLRRRLIRSKNEMAYLTRISPAWGHRRDQSFLGGGDAGRARGAARRDEPRDQAVRDFAADDRHAEHVRPAVGTISIRMPAST